MTTIKLLIADDDGNFREMLATLAELDPRFELVGVAANGADAAKMAYEQHPDAILLDWQMPQGGGTGAARMIRRFAPDTPIVLMSAYADILSDIPNAHEAGIDAVVEKRPTVVEDAFEAVERLVRDGRRSIA